MNKQKKVLSLGIIILLFAVIAIQNKDKFSTIFLNKEEINKLIDKLKLLQSELQKHININKNIIFQKKTFEKRKKDFIFVKDEKPNLIDIEKKILPIIELSEVKMDSLSSIVYSKMTDNIFIGETSIRIIGNFKTVTDFLIYITEVKPKFYFDNTRLSKHRRDNNEITFSGKLKFICIIKK